MKDFILQEIIKIVVKFDIERVVLFGSRARGDHSPVSDYDIAVFGDRLTINDQALLWDEIEEIETLKKIDLVFVDGNSASDFVQNIENEGVIIYEQTVNQN